MEVDTRSIVVVRAAIQNAEGQILFMRRGYDNQTSPGVWELPGGKMDDNEWLRMTLGREILEETGLLIIESDLAYVYSTVLPDGPNKGCPYAVIVHAAKLAHGFVGLNEDTDELYVARQSHEATLSPEHCEAVWLPLNEGLLLDPLKEECQKALEALRPLLT